MEILGALSAPTGVPTNVIHQKPQRLNNQEAIISATVGSYTNSIEEDHCNRNQKFVVPISENTTTIGDEEELSGDGSPAEFESPNNQEELEMAFISRHDDPNIIEENEQTTRENGNGRNVSTYLLTSALSLLGVVFVKLKQDNHTPLHIANPFMLLPVIASGMAYVTFSILSWMHDHSDYMILKGVYYICCDVAFLSLLAMLFTTS